MTAEQLVALLQLLADLRIQLAQLAQENAELREQLRKASDAGTI